MLLSLIFIIQKYPRNIDNKPNLKFIYISNVIHWYHQFDQWIGQSLTQIRPLYGSRLDLIIKTLINIGENYLKG